MLKRIGALLLSLALLVNAASALAAPNDAALFTRDTEDRTAPQVETAVAVGNVLYILVRSNDEQEGATRFSMYRYTLGQADAPELVADNLFYARWYSRLEDARSDAEAIGTSPEEGIGFLFSEGDQLYSLNNLTGAVTKLSFADGKLAHEIAATLDMTQLYIQDGDYSYLMDITFPVMAGGHLYFAASDWSGAEPRYLLFDCDAASGSLKSVQLKQRLSSLAPYKEGLLLTYINQSWDEAAQKSIPAALGEVNPQDGTLTRLYEFEDTNLYISGMSYAPENDTLYYYANSTVWAMPGLGAPQKVAYANVSYASGTALLGTYFVTWDSNGLEIRNTDPAYLPTKTLTLIGSWRNDAARAFSAQNPDVPLIFANDWYDMSSLGQAMVSGDKTIDIISYGVSSGFDTLLKKNYCADLSSSEKLMTFAQSLYPVIQKEIMKDGKLCAIPVGAYGYGMTYNPDYLEKMGLTAADLPTNYIELCEFITRWNNEWADHEETANILPISTGNHRKAVFELMLNSYIDYYDSLGEPLDFNTPLFNSLLTALDAMDSSNLDMPADATDEEYDEFYQLHTALFDRDMSMLSEPRGDYPRVPLNLALSGDVDYTAGIHLEVMFVNPKCENLPEAIALLENYADNLEATYRVILSPEANDPIPNAYFEENVKSWQNSISEYTKALETCEPSQRKDYEDAIAYVQKLLDNQEDYRYDLSAQTIALYRETQGSHLFVRHQNPLYMGSGDTGNQIASLHERYLQRQMTKEQYIKELSQKVRMIVMENQ